MRHRLPILLLLLAALALPACGKRRVRGPGTREGAGLFDPRSADEGRGTGRVSGETARARTIVTQMVFFGFDRYDLSREAEQILAEKVDVLRANPEVRLRVEGHADERGSTEYNLALGMRRANAAVSYLIRHDLDAGRFDVVSFGEERPLDPRQYEAAWARNRRVEFHVIAGSEALRTREDR